MTPLEQHRGAPFDAAGGVRVSGPYCCPLHAGVTYRAAKAALRVAVLEALAAGQSEASVARDAGIARMTVRAWKRDNG